MLREQQFLSASWQVSASLDFLQSQSTTQATSWESTTKVVVQHRHCYQHLLPTELLNLSIRLFFFNLKDAYIITETWTYFTKLLQVILGELGY